jgi:hypothetical protein
VLGGLPVGKIATQKENIMRTAMLNKPTLANLALIALSILAAPFSRAECGVVAHNGNTLSPQLKSLQEPAVQGEEGDSDQADLPNASVTVLGLWKKVYFDEHGVLNDIGLAQFNAGGTELLNDVGAFNAGTNFCVGAWKKVGPRSYDLVHTFYIFDENNAKIAIGVSIETSHLVVSRDGNRFTGKWTQDNYDLSGVLMPGTHFKGTISGTRIAPGPEYPFPLPL